MTKLFARLNVVFAALAALVLLQIVVPAHSQDTGDFDPLVTVDLSAPNSVKIIPDPTGSAPTDKVYSFTIPEGYCSNKRYGSGADSDCTWKSTRSSIRENVSATKKNGSVQPKQAWYGWSVYFPEDFKYGQKQTRGHYEFAYWHNGQCPHLTFFNLAGLNDTVYLGTNKAEGNYECTPGSRLKVADFKNLVGKWNRFEVFVKWANDDDGEAKVYLDGKFVLHYKGPTLTAGYENKNYFVFGIYLCCTNDVASIKGTNALFAAVKRADTREGLYTAEDKAALKSLQEALNGLSCNVGTANGESSKRTREMALGCKAFKDGAMPGDLNASTVRTFLSLYTGKGVADLSKGSFDDSSGDVTVPSGLPEPEYEVRSSEELAMKRGRDYEVNTTFTGRVMKHKTVGSFKFSMLGDFDYSNNTFYELSFYFDDNIKISNAVKACGVAPTLRFPDGTDHALIHFNRKGNSFVPSNAECLMAALPKKLSNVIRFLMNNFRDFAVGMVKDGSVNLIGHDGLKTFMNRVALGEITIGM